jgi:hypothetical protein
MANNRAATLPEFRGVDGEGQGAGPSHRYVLLSAGDRSLYNPLGIRWDEAFAFLYRDFQQHPHAAYVGFYLSYDFNQILKSLPMAKAWLLLTRAGKAIRKPKNKDNYIRSFPVRARAKYGPGPGWEFDMLGFKQLQIRPMVCECRINGESCKHKQLPWMTICDAGPFFQMPFIRLINAKTWEDDPDGSPCTPEEFERISAGKDNRATATYGPEMVSYNILENDILARVMRRLAAGMASIGVRLDKTQWYGPGATASRWLGNNSSIKRRELDELLPEWAFDILRGSYYGGWFEIFSHGFIQGSSYNYDINSAYPSSTAALPCLYHGIWKRGTGNPSIRESEYMLCYATVLGRSNRIGPVPYRRKDGTILRPIRSQGWYWLDEIQAAQRAGLVDTYRVEKWISFTPQCDHKPYAAIADLYEMRRKIGKNSAVGLAIKLIINSIYGKFAQSIGGAPFGNWFYASRITAGCRIQILHAISTHPGGPDSTLMVATDGIVFDSPHPFLPISKKLGEWDETEYHELVLFKPGVYWHKKGLEAVYECKTRGVPRKHFLENIYLAEEIFSNWWITNGMPGYAQRGVTEDGWPILRIPVDFSMTSCLQALMRNKWELGGMVNPTTNLQQDSNPYQKRYNPTWNRKKRRMDSFVYSLEDIESMPYKSREKPEAELDKYGIGMDGAIEEEAGSVMDALRGDKIWDTAGDAGNGAF